MSKYFINWIFSIRSIFYINYNCVKFHTLLCTYHVCTIFIKRGTKKFLLHVLIFNIYRILKVIYNSCNYFQNNLVRNNVGGLLVRADSRGSATSLRGWIHNNLFFENHDLPCLQVEGNSYIVIVISSLCIPHIAVGKWNPVFRHSTFSAEFWRHCVLSGGTRCMVIAIPLPLVNPFYNG